MTKHSGFLTLALDRSVRHYDEFGRLHVRVAHISKANICPYFGHEIPNSEELGLKSGQVYKLFRHPEELEKSVPTWNNLPLLSKHIPHSADTPRKDHTAGATGSDAEFKDPYLDNSLVIWDGDFIASIESGEQKELSCGYAYRADMTPGEYKGEKYDGIMRDIIGNHVALVEEGRAGKDVVIGDSKPRQFSKRVSMKETVRDKARKAAVRHFVQLNKNKIAQDADISDLVDLLDAMSNANANGPQEGDTEAVDTEKNDVQQQKPAAPGAPPEAGGGAPPPEAGGGGGETDKVMADLQAAGCPPELLQRVMQALGGGGAPASAPAAAPAAPEAPKAAAPAAPAAPKAPEAPKPAAAAPEKKPDGQDECAEEMMPGYDESEEDMEHEKEEDETEAENVDGEDEEDGSEMEVDGEDEDTDDGVPEEDNDPLDQFGKKEGGPAKEADGSQLTVDRKKHGMDTKHAMDKAIRDQVAKGINKYKNAQRRLREAELAVKPFIGNIDVSACDNASSVYRMALDAYGVEHKNIKEFAALKAMVQLLPRPTANTTPRVRIAQDSANEMSDKVLEYFPDLYRIKSQG